MSEPEANIFQQIDSSNPRIFAFRASGKLTEEDYAAFLPNLEEVIRAGEGVPLYVELEDFHGWEPKAAWDDLKFSFEYAPDIVRIAVVGEHAWQRVATLLMKPLIGARMRYFPADEKQQAWDWVREASAPEAPGEPLTRYHHLLLATDFSPQADRALERAVLEARQAQAKLTLLHAVEELTLYGDYYEPMLSEIMSLDQERVKRAKEQLAKTASILALEAVATEVLTGRPKDVILNFAAEHGVDLIVIASHEGSALRHLLGSTATSVLGGARCDVLIVNA